MKSPSHGERCKGGTETWRLVKKITSPSQVTKAQSFVFELKHRCILIQWCRLCVDQSEFETATIWLRAKGMTSGTASGNLYGIAGLV